MHPIGIFDSGVGGLSVAQAIQKRLPKENLLYIADSRYAPYGERDEDWIIKRCKQIGEYFLACQCKAIVMACNTATAAAVKALRESITLPIIGLEPAIKPAVNLSQKGVIGVLATPRTLSSEKYRALRAQFEDQAEFIEVASTRLVSLVESGDIYSTAALDVIREALGPLLSSPIDTLVLGCTHFPFLNKPLQSLLGDGVTLLDSAAPVAAEVARRIADNPNRVNREGEIRFLSSDAEKARPIFTNLIGRPVSVEQLSF